MSSLKKSGEKIWVVVYECPEECREFFDSERAATEHVKELMKSFVDDWSEDASDFLRLIEEDPYEAMSQWTELTGNQEVIFIEEKDLWTYVTNIDLLRRAVEQGEEE